MKRIYIKPTTQAYRLDMKHNLLIGSLYEVESTGLSTDPMGLGLMEDPTIPWINAW